MGNQNELILPEILNFKINQKRKEKKLSNE